MMLAFTSVFLVVQRKTIDLHHVLTQESASQVANLVKTEIELAKKVKDGYRRTFFLPDFINGNEYSIEILDELELKITYRDKQYLAFFTQDITGTIVKGYNEIAKVENILYLNCNDEPFLIRDNPDTCSEVGDCVAWRAANPCYLCCDAGFCC